MLVLSFKSKFKVKNHKSWSTASFPIFKPALTFSSIQNLRLTFCIQRCVVHKQLKMHYTSTNLVKISLIVSKICIFRVPALKKNWTSYQNHFFIRHPKHIAEIYLVAKLYKTHHPYQFGDYRTSDNLAMAIKGHLNQKHQPHPASKTYGSDTAWSVSST